MTDSAKRSDNRPIIVADSGTSDNQVQPFQIEGMDVRGRAIRLGTAVDEIIIAHDYPKAIATLVGQMVALAGLLGSILKFDGTVTIQAKAKDSAPVNFLVADFDTPGHIRGYADYDAEALAALGADLDFRSLVGHGGYMAMTIDQGADMERYQGIVDLTGESLSDCAVTYFLNSEQTPTALRLAADIDPVSGHWRAGGIMVQHLAHGEEGGPRLLDRNEQENWRRASILMESVKAVELLDPKLDLHSLLYRLYHEDGVRVSEPLDVAHQCRCSRDKLLAVLGTFPEDDLRHMIKDEKIEPFANFAAALIILPPTMWGWQSDAVILALCPYLHNADSAWPRSAQSTRADKSLCARPS
ncbi:33 kDa chaperonin [Iodidimonas gelatinilytica]|uniref:33 kDa chaperonin n=1 Tax=Iodidimonas gelatinilytica TaxID=1236966 RepID=A0A5A7MV00_9PROT|nr:Hsp33 family molecular chaperone HslO [Iodidimonas gelatinilytica]GEQ98715.1 33 kDa chaperonin [Iodidimonas gelatinilytica]